jgi:uncharacterized protein DUF6265
MKLEPLVASALLVLAPCLLPADEAGSDDFAWISGHWCAASGRQRIEEYWTARQGGMLMGLSVTIQDDRAIEFEFLRIVTRDRVPVYVAQPNGDPPVAFKWTAGGSGWARFENPAHDFPKRVEYRRDGEKLRAQIAGPGADGKEQTISFDYSRCATAGSPGAP